MFVIMLLMGLLGVVFGLVALAKGRIGSTVVHRGTAVPLAIVGAYLFGGGILGTFFHSRVSGIIALVGWTCAWVAGYGLITGSIGPLKGRGKSALFLIGTPILLVVAVATQGFGDKAAAATVERDRLAALEAQYQTAATFSKDGKWGSAISALDALKGYKDADSLLVAARYSLGIEYMSQKSWSQAVEVFQQLPTSYKDSESLRTEARYQFAGGFIQQKSWSQALDALKALPPAYKDVSGLTENAKQGLATDLFNGAIKAKQAKDYKESERLLTEAQSVGGKVPGDISAELKVVSGLRAQAEKAEAERIAAAKERETRIATEAGPKPENSAWDAAVLPVTRFLQKNLKDPKSVEYIDWSPVTLTEVKGHLFWAVRCKYRAKNSFGGYVIDQKIFFIQHDTVVDQVDV